MIDNTPFVFESNSAQTTLARIKEQHEANRSDLSAQLQSNEVRFIENSPSILFH
jgi:hypothetical protein